jgi:hypothetical protein
VVLVVTAAAGLAGAQLVEDPDAAPDDPAAEPEPDPATVEASNRFVRGVNYYGAGNFGAALAEFQRAYELTGSWEVLYNLGQVSQALGRLPEAARHFERYLADGGDGIRPQRRAEVEASLATLRADLGTIRVEVDVAGAEILVDDEIVGVTPLAEPLYVEPGPHEVRVRHPDHGTVTREVMLAGGVAETVALVLATPDAPPPPVGGAGPAVEEDGGIASKWWFWTIIGAVVAGGAVTAGVLLAEPTTVWTEADGGFVQLR